MNKLILSIAIIVGIIFGGGYLLINSNPEIKAQAVKIGIIAAPPAIPVPPSYNATFIIPDPSGSGTTQFSVPKISISFINSVIDSISKHGSGDIWLTLIDKDGNNNKVLHLEIPEVPGPTQKPVRLSGERKGEFDKRLVQFEAESKNGLQKLTASRNAFETKRKQFIADCEVMIDVGYAVKKRNEDFSDCIGSLNAALRSLETAPHDSTHFRSILFISDGVQDLQPGTVPKTLNPIPKDVRIVTVNHSGSQNNVVQGHTIEVDNLDRGLEKVLQYYKPINP